MMNRRLLAPLCALALPLLTSCEQPQSCGGADEAAACGNDDEVGTDSGTTDVGTDTGTSTDTTTTDTGTDTTTTDTSDTTDTGNELCEPAEDDMLGDGAMDFMVTNNAAEPIYLIHTTDDECLAITPFLLTKDSKQVQWTTQGPNVSVGGKCSEMGPLCGFGCENSPPPYYTRIEPGASAEFEWTGGYWWELVEVEGSCLGCETPTALCNAGRRAGEGESFQLTAAAVTGCEDNVDFMCSCPNNEPSCQLQGEYNFTGPTAELAMEIVYSNQDVVELVFE